MRIPREDDLVANGDVVHRCPNLLDNAGGLMTQNNRHGIAQNAIDDFKVGVTQSHGLDTYQNVISLKLSGLNCFDHKRRSWRVQNRGLVFERHSGIFPAASS
jgi:hypothetical protein